MLKMYNQLVICPREDPVASSLMTTHIKQIQKSVYFAVDFARLSLNRNTVFSHQSSFKRKFTEVMNHDIFNKHSLMSTSGVFYQSNLVILTLPKK